MPEIAFVLIAGLVARRIVCPLYEGQLLAAGERIGLIRFGSRVDVYIPPPYVPLVALGQRMVAGETVLADRRPHRQPNSRRAAASRIDRPWDRPWDRLIRSIANWCTLAGEAR